MLCGFGTIFLSKKYWHDEKVLNLFNPTSLVPKLSLHIFHCPFFTQQGKKRFIIARTRKILNFIKVIFLSCLGLESLDDPLFLPHFTTGTPKISEDDDEPVLALSQHRPPLLDTVQPSSLAVGYGLSPVTGASPGKLRLVDVVTVNFEKIRLALCFT